MTSHDILKTMSSDYINVRSKIRSPVRIIVRHIAELDRWCSFFLLLQSHSLELIHSNILPQITLTVDLTSRFSVLKINTLCFQNHVLTEPILSNLVRCLCSRIIVPKTAKDQVSPTSWAPETSNLWECVRYSTSRYD